MINRSIVRCGLVALLTLCCLSCSSPYTQNTHHRDTVSTRSPEAIEAEIERLLAQMTLEEKGLLVRANGKFSVSAVERLGIHETWLSDGPHGVREEISRHSWDAAGWTDDYATYLPPLTTVASSWDTEMAALHGDVLGSEARHRRKDFILGPGVNLARLPLYGRNFEYFGEDPFLAGKLAAAEVAAIQNNDVAATVKHYALNTQELNRSGVNARPDARTLREIYLPAFEMAVKEGGALSLMGGYNQVYGTNANQNRHLVMDILKGEWGFQGVLMTDWNVDINTFDAAMNGLDLEMGTDVERYQDYYLGEPLLAMIRRGDIPESVLDDKVRRMLRVQLTIGMMDKHRLSGQRNTLAHQQAARKIAQDGIVLLKNETDILPLNPSNLKDVLVLGPNVDRPHGAGGGSSTVKALYEVTPLEGLKNALGQSARIEFMRMRKPGAVRPIDNIFVETRHWTGTPAWNVDFFESPKREQRLSFDTTSDSSYKVVGDTEQFLTMRADVRPKAAGEHIFKVTAQGDITVRIDGKEHFSLASREAKIHRFGVVLEQDVTYKIEIDYGGKQGFLLGWDTPGNIFSTEAEVIAAAKKADAVIYIGGLSHGDDREAIDRTDMVLPDEQDAEINTLLAANPNTLVIMIAGSAVEMPWADRAKALLWTSYGGMEAGNALADVIFGDVNPSGKLPFTLPVKLEHTPAIALNDYNAEQNLYPEGVFMGYRWFEQQGIAPLFPFGFGLSYTTFKYSDMRLSHEKLPRGERLVVTAKVSNTGSKPGAEVVQLYINDELAAVPRPVKELKGFAKVFLQPGETKSVAFELDRRAFSFWDVDTNNWLAEPGQFNVWLAAAVDDVRLTKSFTLIE
ncbi:MAG TPA: glycoside hydrolase family 3 C-terminal domain-containing protein [Marinagarivorans sp.]